MCARMVLVTYLSAQSSVTEKPVQDREHLEAKMDPIGRFSVLQTDS